MVYGTGTGPYWNGFDTVFKHLLEHCAPSPISNPPSICKLPGVLHLSLYLSTHRENPTSGTSPSPFSNRNNTADRAPFRSSIDLHTDSYQDVYRDVQLDYGFVIWWGFSICITTNRLSAPCPGLCRGWWDGAGSRKGGDRR